VQFKDFEHNGVWPEIVRIAHDLIVWTQRLLLTGKLARCEPKRLRYRLRHVAAGSRSTPAQQHCEYRQAGPAPTISPSRSSASAWFQRLRPDPDRQSRDDQPHLRRDVPREACQRTRVNPPPAPRTHCNTHDPTPRHNLNCPTTHRPAKHSHHPLLQDPG
jgi:hypothetical protein